jgi:hypothetical protein
LALDLNHDGVYPAIAHAWGLETRTLKLIFAKAVSADRKYAFCTKAAERCWFVSLQLYNKAITGIQSRVCVQEGDASEEFGGPIQQQSASTTIAELDE